MRSDVWERRAGNGHKRVRSRIVPTRGHAAAEIVQCDSQCMPDGRVNHRQRAIRRFGGCRVVAIAYVAAGGVGAIASRQKRVGLIRNQVVPLTRGEEALKIH